MDVFSSLLAHPYILVIIVVALGFDYTNGRNDSANSVATLISTRVLPPRMALAFAAFFNISALFIYGTAVAKTVGSGLIDLSIVTPTVVLTGLIAAIIWNITTHHLGIPSSSSHALFGGYMGAAIAKAGTGAVLGFPFTANWFANIHAHGVLGGLMMGWSKILIFILIAPLIGAMVGFVMLIATSWIVRSMSPSKLNKRLIPLRLTSAAAYSIEHGANDAQKTMGIIFALLIAGGIYAPTMTEIPVWVQVASYAAIGAGTLSGGMRIIRTMGTKILKLRSIDAFSAELGSALSIFTATHYGAPVSTTHVITGAISGVGTTRGVHRVHWQVARNIVMTWFTTIPIACAIAWIIYKVFTNFGLQ